MAWENSTQVVVVDNIRIESHIYHNVIQGCHFEIDAVPMQCEKIYFNSQPNKCIFFYLCKIYIDIAKLALYKKTLGNIRHMLTVTSWKFTDKVDV